MSQEINQVTPTPQPPRPPKRNDAMIYVVIILVLLAVIIYLMVTRHNVTTQYEQTSAQLATADSSRKSVENDYNAALSRLDQLTSKNAQMDSLINDRNGEVTRLKQQIQGILSDSRATAEQLKRARGLIQQLNSKTKSYEERIAELEGENNTLTNNNQSLTKQRDSTATQAATLKQIGSVLHASNIRMVPIHIKHNGKEKGTERARRVNVFHIIFDIDENRIAESGTKEVDIRITAPDGSLLSNAAYGSGVLTMSNGSTVNYTLAKQIPLEQGQPVKNVSIDWRQDSDYKKGLYTLELYNGGYKIGSGSVTLK
ncbi:MAG: hypothetical protein H0X33_09045 [Taibaiella sp.]|nr:hypothetical protein [Taibaiella sp.]